MNPHPTNIRKFWDWFSAHKQELDSIVDSESKLWNQAIAQLKVIDSRFWFELSRPDGTPREFILTAEGAKEVFSLVEKTIAAAPIFSDWRFIALKPAKGFNFSMRYEGVHLEPKKMWFLPLQNASRPKDLALRIGVPDLKPEAQRQASNGVLVILDTAIGERSAAVDIAHVEICALPLDPDKEGFIELPELPMYIDWHKRKYGTEEPVSKDNG